MSVASKLFLFSAFPLRAQKPITLIPPRLLTNHLALSSLRFRRYCSTAAVDSVTACDTDAPNTPPHHPWPEWISFVDRLKAQGYFEGQNVADDATVKDGDSFRVYTDMNLVKDACLSFARDRYDIFKSLSVEDIKTVVDRGCPNLLRKAVNSSKRLRAHVRLDEGDVCGVCNLRGSCDRAYVILKESEAAARTIDIVRVLLYYALDPLVITGGDKSPGRELVDASTKKLLSELIELSETSLDPSLPKPASKAPQQKVQAVKFFEDDPYQNVEMKRGDWMCPKCNFLNFSRNTQCIKCKEDGPRKIGTAEIEMKKGDWICLECNFMNFSRNRLCLKCKAVGPKRIDVDEAEMKKGDWNCPQCGFMNFASNKNCLRCHVIRPKRELLPGEWECCSCDFINFRRNKVCLKCNSGRPGKATTEYEEQIWRSPH